jgi:hypothetical protein
VRDAALSVELPQGGDVELFYPDTGEKVEFTRDKNTISFQVRDFSDYELVVVKKLEPRNGNQR